MVDGAALQVAAVGDADHDRALVAAVRAPADERELVADLHEGRPDVVDELHLGHRLQPARRDPDRAPDDVGFGERRVVDAVRAVAPLQVVRDLEDAALALHLAEARLARAVRDVLAEHHDARVARHLVVEAGVQQVDHRARVALRLRLAGERRRGGVDVLRVHVAGRGLGRGRRRGQRFVGRRGDLAVDLLAQPRQVDLGQGALVLEVSREQQQRVALGVLRALGGRAVERLVVGQRVRVRPDHVRVHERRSLARAAPGRGLAEHREARERVAAVHLAHQQVRKAAHEPRDAAAGGLHLDRHRDRVAVVLDQVEHRQLQVAGRVQALPELALGGGAVAGRAVDDLVGGERRRRGARVPGREVEARLGAAHGMQELRAGRRGARDHVESGVAPVRGHLAAARARVVLGSHRAEQHLERRHAELQQERAVAVVGEEPVVAGPQHEAGRGQHGLVAGAADLEVDPVLALELDLLVVEPARQEHGAVDPDERVPVGTRAAVGG